MALSERCGRLTEARFDACSRLTDRAVAALAARCQGLRGVEFEYCQLLTDAAVDALGGPSLERVNLADTRTSGRAVLALAFRSPRLSQLRVKSYHHGDADHVALAELAETFPGLCTATP